MFQGRQDISIIWETRHSMLWEKGHFFSGNRDILPSGNHFFLWESDHFFSEIRDILWETGHGTRYPIGFGPLILWESGILESVLYHINYTQTKQITLDSVH